MSTAKWQNSAGSKKIFTICHLVVHRSKILMFTKILMFIKFLKFTFLITLQ